MPLKLWSCLTVLSCTLGCAASSLPGAPSSSEPTTPGATTTTAATAKRAPLQLTLSGPTQPKAGEPLPLTAQVTRNQPFSVPIDVTLRLPEGVRLMEGESVQQILPSADAGTRSLRFVIVADPLPSEDITLVLDAHGQGFGFHTEKAYRFGRPQALTPSVPLGEALKVGSHNAGPSVKLTPRAPQK